MDNSDKTIVLVTGANRGIGFALVQTYLTRPNHIVVAAVRSPGTFKALEALPRLTTTSLLPATIDSSDHTSAGKALDTLKSTYGISHLSVVIANAGISKIYPTAASVQLDDIREHLEVNTFGPVILFQACLPLLLPGSKFVAISSIAGSIGIMGPGAAPNSAYGPSKAALNYLMRKMHHENGELVVFPIDPGWVQTEMGNTAAQKWGVESAPTTIEESAGGIIKVIDDATRENSGGKFMAYNGGETPW
ncbi:putative aflatoxin biosynthesis ketoreductase nor-1 [Aulographum hederae CBS 113979]|uniref:Putative aflatoxin biosynthesis ketoreductase nor-1 n=1 Tax=Aulographum hederae CBS 113979 TaxID=1176131 RepID=A0A6G1GIR6_9PEZI|nr:putative aflatoxin biosynthesis ketoreductase nor-1 [Aulographum hederae CBS 113979]